MRRYKTFGMGYLATREKLHVRCITFI